MSDGARPEREAQARRSSRSILIVLPLLVFAAFAAMFLARLLSGEDGSAIPSALIGQAAPATSLPPLEGSGVPGLHPAAFRGRVTLVNVWASWCAPCRQEHPVLLGLARDGRFDVVGMNYKDKPDNARSFLGELGNPYSAVGVDANGRVAIDWGVYGVPETYVVDREGRIRYRHVGPLSAESVAGELLPEIEKALVPASGGAVPSS